MERSRNLKQLDNYFFDDLTQKIKFPKRTIYLCFIDTSLTDSCNFKIYSRIPSELSRLFTHFRTKHSGKLLSLMLLWLEKNYVQNLDSISCVSEIIDYIKKQVLPLYLQNKPNLVFQTFESGNRDQLIDLNCIDISKINQIILEKGVYENQPLAVITSPNHTQLYNECLKIGFQFGRNTSISKQDFLKLINNTYVPRSLLKSVGNDYFLASISPFKGAYCSFEIDAGKINQRSLLVFVLHSNQNGSLPILFDFIDNFDSSFFNYRYYVREMILKAFQNDIIICGIVTDNLPVQILAVSHESDKSFQNVFSDVKKIIHLRCCNHLLNLAFRDWTKLKNDLTIYEEKIHNIISVF